jgi:hypothetical protein
VRGSEWHRARMTPPETPSASHAGVGRKLKSRTSASSLFFTCACSLSTKASILPVGWLSIKARTQYILGQDRTSSPNHLMSKKGSILGESSRPSAVLTRQEALFQTGSMAPESSPARTPWLQAAAPTGQVRFITLPKSRTMRAKRKKRSRANRTKVPK